MKHVLLALLLCVGCAAQPLTKVLPLSVHVENEGPQNLQAELGKDLEAAELAKLQELLDSWLSAHKEIQLVDMDDKRTHVEILVSVTKAPRGNGAWYYAASSVVAVAMPKVDEFVSHNVVVGEDLATVAKAIGLSFMGLRERLATQLTPH